MVKRRDIDHVRYGRERRAQANLCRRIETLQMTSKPGLHHCFGKSVAETYVLATRCPVYRRRDSRPGFRTELENLAGDAKGKGTSSETARLKVPMRRAGADCSVIARKRGNARGAKGADLHHSPDPPLAGVCLLERPQADHARSESDLPGGNRRDGGR